MRNKAGLLRTRAAATRRPSCSVVLVNCNGGHWIVRCVESLLAFDQGGCADVIIVDNASTDGSREALLERFQEPRVRVLTLPHNLGFGAANNRGAALSGAEYLLFLNSDCELIEDPFPRLVGHMQSHSETGAVFCRILNGDRTLQPSVNRRFPSPAGFLLEWLGWSTLRFAVYRSAFFKQIVFGRTVRWHASEHPVAWGGGNCVFMRRGDFSTIGGFDERFFMYFEDVDLCLRLARRGRVAYYIPAPSIIHHWAKSRPSGDVLPLVENYRSRLRYVQKHHPAWFGMVKRTTRLELPLRRAGIRCIAWVRGDERLRSSLRNYERASEELESSEFSGAG
ncbi:MAG: glycosyltransferase family 2 protein [Nitrospirae bacterium]|nr:glycosyltransferase family 2 protein [Nitrospirota bacterium]